MPLPTPTQSKGQPTTGGNPAFGGMVERSIRPMRREFSETVLPGISSGFARGGRLPGAPTGIRGGAFETVQDRAADTFMRNVGDVTSGLAYRTYGDERQNMMRALELAPQLAQQDYADIGRLREVGQAREQISSATLGEQMARHAFAQREPRERLEDFMRNISGSFGGTSTTQFPTGAGFNPLLALLGGGALGYGASGSK